MATSSMVTDTGEQLSFGRMGMSIKGSSRMTKDMEMVVLIELMEKDTLGSGRKTN